MKRFFSEYQFNRMLRTDTDIREGLSDEAILYAIGSTTNQGTPPEQAAASALLMAAQCEMLSRRGTDYFLTSRDVEKLILGFTRTFTADVLDIFCEHKATSFIVHPISPTPAVLVGIRTINKKTFAVMHEGGSENTPVYTLGSDNFEKKNQLKPRGYAERLAIGLALYARFYPEALQDGIPEIAKHPNHYRGRQCTGIKVAEDLIDRRGCRPHIRGAHARFLASSKFTHQQGTYIKVKEALIRGGSAKVVVMVEGAEI